MHIDDFIQQNMQDDAKSEFIIKQGRYVGPYTKLLEIIELRKLSISEISLSQIADEYIAYIKGAPYINPLDMSQFIQVASTLMLIKAKSILPTLEYTEEERGQVDNLEKKLELLSELRLAEKNIKEVFGKNVMHHRGKLKIKSEFVTYTKPERLTSENLYSVAMLTLAKIPSLERLRQVAVRQAMRLEKVIERIMEHIGSGIISLKTFARGFGDTEDNKIIKKNIIVSFLAILELLKSGTIDADQKDGDISIIKR